MSNPDNPPSLLSKLAKYVRNPTKDWSALDRPDSEQESGYDKQAIKEMIERKRRNDFIRKREFDQLRKLRSRDVSVVAGQARPSFFQSSIASDSDGRAQTLKKIDDIEAQMSKQWWKGKHEAGTTTPPVAGTTLPPDAAAGTTSNATNTPPPVVRTSRPIRQSSSLGRETLPGDDFTMPASQLEESPLSGIPTNFESEVSLSSTVDFAPTVVGMDMDSTQSPPVIAPKAASASDAPDSKSDSSIGAEINFSFSRLQAIEVAEDMPTDPELEEAAIRYANGDDAGAESALLSALRGFAIDPEVALSWAAALLDMYRATHNRAKFDEALKEFRFCFDNIKPEWTTIGELTAPAVSAPMPPPVSQREVLIDDDVIWMCPSELTAQAMENLREIMTTSPTPWHLDWSRLTRIMPEAVPLLGGLFYSLCNEPVTLRFSGAARLVQTLRMLMPSGERTIDPTWWVVRLNALRTMQMQDEFELVALDYCVTYEVSPPAWEEARCEYENVVATPLSTMAGGIIRSDGEESSGQILTARMGLEMEEACAVELRGQLLGDATQALAVFDPTTYRSNVIVVSCYRLARVDFSAAGSVLNWVVSQQNAGFQVQFRGVHRLVAAFFNVIGINEYARVIPRAM
jgi:hypothetical protein